MPKIAIDLTDKTAIALMGVIADHNDQTGAGFDLAAWAAWYIQEAAVNRQLRATVTALIEEHQQGAQAALEATIKTAHDELLASLDKP